MAPLFLGGGIVASAVDVDATRIEPVFIPAGVSDAQGSVGCLRTPAGGVEAVDLATGRSLWRSAAPARALMVASDRAYVLEERDGGRLRLAAYAPRKGGPVRVYDLTGLGFPAWASLREPVAGRESTGVEVAACLAGGHLEIHYDAIVSRVSGFQAPRAVRRAEGTAVVDLDTGVVTSRPGGWPASPLTEALPDRKDARWIAIHARAADATIVLGGPPPNVPGALIAGDLRFGFELSADRRTLLVHRWKAAEGEREPPRRIERGWEIDAVWVTLDRRHVLLRNAGSQRLHELYSLDTGEALGKLEAPADAAVVGGLVYWTTRESDGRVVLMARGAGTSRTAWRRMVRGPDPPPGAPIP